MEQWRRVKETGGGEKVNEWWCFLFGLADCTCSSEKSPTVSLIPSSPLPPEELIEVLHEQNEPVCVCLCALSIHDVCVCA